MSEASRFSFGFIPMIDLLILMAMVNIPWNMSRKSVLKTNALFVWLGSCIEPVLFKTRCLGGRFYSILGSPWTASFRPPENIQNGPPIQESVGGKTCWLEHISCLQVKISEKTGFSVCVAAISLCHLTVKSRRCSIARFSLSNWSLPKAVIGMVPPEKKIGFFFGQLEHGGRFFSSFFK